MASPDAIRAQLAIWERLMHVNVKTHAALRSINQFPRGQEAQKLSDELTPELKEKQMQVRRNIFKLIDHLRVLEEKLREKSKTVEKREEDDDEIVSSDSEAEGENAEAEGEDGEDLEMEENEEEQKVEEKTAKALKVNKSSITTLETAVQRQYKTFSKNRDTILEKWYERTRLAVSNKTSKDNFEALETSAVRQINNLLTDRSRLIRRTQLKRVNTDRIAGPSEQTYDPEIFDDDDFYQTLLKEFIDQKTSQSADPIQISRQWLEMQKLRQRRMKKRTVDKRATKGRQTRLVPIPKLANFIAAEPEKVNWTHEKRNELFKSIFRY